MRSIPATRHSSIAFALIASLAVTGCGTDVASTAPSGASAPPASAPPASAPPPTAAGPSSTPRAAAEVYAEIRAAVEAIRGLQPTKAVEPVSLDETQLLANLTAEFDRENTAAELKLGEDELITLGLLPEGTSLRQVNLDFQGGQVAGYYSPEKDQLFVVSRSGGLGGAEMVTYAHEFTHQLDDQALGLDALGLDVADQSDRQLGRLALVEGDATSVQTAYMTANLTSQQLGEVVAAAMDPKAIEALQKAPPFVRETALFPYNAGLAFVTTLLAGGGYTAVDAAFKDPPNSTEQIIHPEKYVSREAPIVVTLPDVAKALGSGWTAAGQDTLGEEILTIWLTLNGVPKAEAAPAAAGWGGDRLVVLRGPDAAVAIVMVSAWDSAADAAAFQLAAATAARSVDADAAVFSDGLRQVHVILGDNTAEIAAALPG